MAGPSSDDLKALALTRLGDAHLLLEGGRYAGAYYLAGYAVECGLKAIIARSFRQSVIPDRTLVQKVYSHDLESLVALAKLKAQLDDRLRSNAAFDANWTVVSRWREASRYEMVEPILASRIVEAVGGQPEGVLTWLQDHW